MVLLLEVIKRHSLWVIVEIKRRVVHVIVNDFKTHNIIVHNFKITTMP